VVELLQHQKFRQYFTQTFGENFCPEDRIFQKYRNIFNIFWKNLYFQNFGKKENIGEHSICNFSIKNCWGRKIAQAGGEIFAKVSQKIEAKIRENFMSSNFTKTTIVTKYNAIEQKINKYNNKHP